MDVYPILMQETLLREVRRRLFDEGVPRLKKCLDQLTDEEIWQRPNANSNSMGNLVLHLTGNVRQWIIAGLDEQEDTRQRQAEFDEKGPIDRQQMLADLDAVMEEAEEVLNRLTPEKLLQQFDVQGFQETGIGILLHVVEHFSYHVGQMTYYVKALKDMDMGYYAGLDLEAKRAEK